MRVNQLSVVLPFFTWDYSGGDHRFLVSCAECPPLGCSALFWHSSLVHDHLHTIRYGAISTTAKTALKCKVACVKERLL